MKSYLQTVQKKITRIISEIYLQIYAIDCKQLTDFILFFYKRDHFFDLSFSFIDLYYSRYYTNINLMIVKINIKNILAKI